MVQIAHKIILVLNTKNKKVKTRSSDELLEGTILKC
jgi:hypothetical protein